MRPPPFFVIAFSHLLLTASLLAAEPIAITADQSAFFETRIRPVLVEKCYKCHSTTGDKIKGGLLLDTRAALLKGGDTGPAIIPNDPEKSLLIQAIRHTNEDLQMPPKGKLTDEQIADFVTWVRMGAPDPRTDSPSTNEESASAAFTAAERAHWAFQPVKRPEIPTVRSVDRVKSPVDAFILQRLEAASITPAPPADKTTLLRRAYFDLIGLPPTPEEVATFLNDTSPTAFNRIVERLLASPHYGERWARHWLDLARYAESDGFREDATRPNAWRYRDYVIKSFNDDKPYDRFVQEQIAGDELFPNDPDAKIATAFNRHYPDEWNARDLVQRRQEILNDITDTVAAVFTGMTVACARCHNHKYDAIRQADYYRLQAFFANTSHDDHIPLLSPDEESQYRAKLATWEAATHDLRAEIAKIEKPHTDFVVKEHFDKYPPEIQAMVIKPAAGRTPYERMMVAKANQYIDPAGFRFVGAPERIAGRIKGKDKERYDALKNQLADFQHLHPGDLPETIGMTDLGPVAPPTHLLNRGIYDQPKNELQPGFLSVLHPNPPSITPTATSTGRRSALARILTDPKNPLTARVMVNRIWQYHFGRGIVPTPSDFGTQGAPPSHPELLDYLATEFMQHNWSIKHLHRLIMLSSTYHQSSTPSSIENQNSEFANLLPHFPRHRLEAEIIRDSMLSVAGLLNPEMAGPSVFPALPSNSSGLGPWKVTADPEQRNRRSIYVFARRNNRYPLLETFDAPDTLETCARRNVTTTPMQALTMLNSDLTLDWARHLAARVLEQSPTTLDAQIDTAFRLTCSRPARPEERETIKQFFTTHREVLEERLKNDEPLALPRGLTDATDPIHAATLVDFCHTLMNANEFVYRN
jgi:mono/diheme cytochrome c family protein